ncbi:MAG: DUF2911 domain-containing protein [Reichenbachiella sp.]
MKNKILLGAIALVLLFFGFMTYSVLTTKKHSPEAISSFNKNGLELSVKYCRPYKKGRVIFGELLPYGGYWRAGANDPTIVSFSQNVKFAGQLVEAGSYRVYAIPYENEWEVSLNTELEEWGFWEPDYSLDVVKVKVPIEKIDCCIEQLLIDFQEAGDQVNLMLMWDDTFVKIPISQ